MSLIVKGIDMPKYKGEHKNFDRYGCFLTVYKNGEVELHVFENDYTIEEIPTPHGRLIDADRAAVAILMMNSHPCGHSIENISDVVDWLKIKDNNIAFPTIIEAEASE